MAANKEFLTDILDGVIAVQQFLSEGLAKESLTSGCEVQRKNALQVLDSLARKIQSSHPSIRPRVNTPGKINKPVLSPPIPGTLITKPPPIEEDGELYEEPPVEGGSGPQASDYLSFYPASGEQVDNRLEESEDEQETYEAMEAGQNQQEDEVFADNTVENYEDPVLSRPSNISTTSLPSPRHSPAPPTQPPPPPVASKGLSEGEYATTIGMGKEGEEEFEESMAMDWGTVYTTPPKGEKLRVKDLKNVKIKGPLEKLGGRNHKTWQKRYCVLAGALMYFYEKEGNRTYNNCIAIPSFTANLAPNITDTKKHYGFKLSQEDKSTGKHKDYYFRTNSAELRDKWLSCIQNVESSTTPSSLFPSRNVAVASTLPRMPSSAPSLKPPIQPLGEKKRSHSLTEVIEEGDGELYEDMAVDKRDSEDDDDEEYVDVDPSQEQDKVSLEEYVDVVPQELEQEEYEEPSSLQPPPPQSPPPGPPSEIFVPPPTQPKAAPRSTISKSSISRSPAPTSPAPAPPSEPAVDTSKVYTQSDIPLSNVYVSQWDFVAGETDELGLKRGDLVLVTKPLDSELWWYGELLNPDASRKVGRAGFFPKDYSTLAFESVSS